jgi:dTDP-4-amino-4,6-dideoxygalactose transaminase
LPPLPLGVYARKAVRELPFPLGAVGSRVYARARHGLWHGMQALGLQPGDDVLTPAYHHGSEVEALVRAGLTPRFYAAGDALEPDADELRRLLTPGTRALYLTHYLGFPQDAARWRAWCDEQELLLVEDAAQAWLATLDGVPLGSFGDLSIFCMYKTFGIPDGGIVLVRPPAAPPSGPRGRAPLGLGAAARRNALWLLQRSARLSALAPDAPSQPYDPKADFALGDPDSPPVLVSMALLRRIVDGEAAAHRRQHYATILAELSDRASPPFDRVPAGASPFAFPMETDDKEDALRRLAAHGILGLDFWSVPHSTLDVARFPEAARRRARTVALPVHQELKPHDLRRIVAAAHGTRH